MNRAMTTRYVHEYRARYLYRGAIPRLTHSGLIDPLLDGQRRKAAKPARGRA